MAHQPTIEKLAGQVHSHLQFAGYGFDPTVIITIITTILSLFKDCGLNSSQAERRAANPRLLDRFLLRRIVRQNASSQDDAEALQAAILDAGAEATAADMASMFSEMP